MHSRRVWRAALAATLMPFAGTSLHAASVASFTGGDPGEGLDLQGNFAYALNIGPNGPGGKVGDAEFTGDDTPGATVEAQNQIASGGWSAMALGTTDNDQRLGFILGSIRWSASPNVVTLKLKVEKDIEYKLQLLFSESCCAGRGFNVVIDGKTELENFIPARIQAGDGDFTENRSKFGAVVTQQFKATSDTITIVLDGAAATSEEITDRNAIINGLTLERISPVTDTDADGLRDDWEKKFFNNLDAAATGDADADGLTNLEEQTLGTDPTKPDTDGDTLKDGDEVKTYRSSPTNKDSDGDGLEDGTEVNVHRTNPTKTDSDDDGISDTRELSLGSDPANKNSKPLLTSIGVVTGGDPGEGLDLDGNFPYALSFGGNDAANVKIRDAQFQPLIDAEVPGAEILAGNTIANWYVVKYGDSDNDTSLAAATGSIRWSAAASPTQPDVVLTLSDLEVGAQYKLQMIFGEQCCNRGFDVFLDGNLIVKDFNPGQVHGGIANGKQTALITRTHFARDTKLVLRLDGRTASAAFGDHNAIFNALTLEKVTPKTDTDNDGLPDEWEKLYFGGLTETAAGDPDKDGLTNAQEYAIGSDPKLADTDRDGLSDSEEQTAGSSPLAADTDGDGLKDGDEIKTYKTNPKKTDSDDDGLSDGSELLTYKTDPAKADTDGDGTADGKEVASGSDPLKFEKATVFKNITVGSFSGGDPGEGLDLQGRFLYAINVSSAGAAGKAGDANFTADNVAGVRVVAANNLPNWSTPDYGDTPADTVMEKVTQSIRYGTTWRIEFSGLVPESTYKLQLFFYEQCCASRGFNVSADGVLLAEAFMPAEVQGGVNNTAAGAVISAEFTTYRDKVVIIGDGPAGQAASPDTIRDTNAILDGATLEVLNEATPRTAPTLRIGGTGASTVITFEGTLQAADSVSGPYSDVPGSGSVTITPSGTQKYFRAVRK